MEWVLIYLVLAGIVGVAANTRGRFGFGWFLLALVISPLIAGLLVLALPRVDAKRIDESFVPDAVLAGTPYRTREGGTIEAMTKGGLVRFRNMDQFRAAAEGRDADQSTSGFQDEVDGVRYKINIDHTVTALTHVGSRTYRSWTSFRQATKTRRW